jgi:hypothetical protein
MSGAPQLASAVTATASTREREDMCDIRGNYARE